MKKLILAIIMAAMIAMPMAAIAANVQLKARAGMVYDIQTEGEYKVIYMDLTNNSGTDHGKVDVILSVHENKSGSPCIEKVVKRLDEFKNGETYKVVMKLKTWGKENCFPRFRVEIVE